MKPLLTAVLLLACLHPVRAQNLIGNSGFEDRNVCSELHAICAPEAWFRIPLSPVTIAAGTAGFLVGNKYDNLVMENVRRPYVNRSYLYTRVLCPLEKGREYVFTASFRVSNDNRFYRVNLLWLPFEPFHFQEKWAVEKAKRLTIHAEDKINDESFGWKQYSIRFTAAGDEEYLLIGNLEKEIFPGKPTMQARTLIIYEIDNVALYPADATVKACAERDLNEKKLYQHNFRHTPGKFLDEVDPPVVVEQKKDTPPPPPKTDTVPTPPPPVVNDTLVIPDVLFKFDKKDLNPEFAYRLDSLIEKIRNKTFKRIEILGHTDSLGNRQYNESLSLARANTVKDYLVDRLNYPPEIILTRGFAATLPVSSNTNAAGRQKNRRVEIVLIR